MIEEPIERDALAAISEVAAAIQDLASRGLQDCDEPNAVAELLVSIRELAGVCGWHAERYGAGCYSTDHFFIQGTPADRLIATESSASTPPENGEFIGLSNEAQP